MDTNGMTQCFCGSGKSHRECCEPYLTGAAAPPTAEALMRARYSAYASANIDFVERTTHSSARADFNRDSARTWAEQSEWQGLKILETVNGAGEDDRGTVEFIATYAKDGETIEHHEIATFRREAGDWAFVDGRISNQPFRRDQPKIGRNDPCSCGSGKKYKKCCGQKQP